MMWDFRSRRTWKLWISQSNYFGSGVKAITPCHIRLGVYSAHYAISDNRMAHFVHLWCAVSIQPYRQLTGVDRLGVTYTTLGDYIHVPVYQVTTPSPCYLPRGAYDCDLLQQEHGVLQGTNREQENDHSYLRIKPHTAV